MLAGKAPDAVTWEADEVELINEARILLLTGWTHDEYENTPLVILDALAQVHAADDELKAWAARQAQIKARRR